MHLVVSPGMAPRGRAGACPRYGMRGAVLVRKFFNTPPRRVTRYQVHGNALVHDSDAGLLQVGQDETRSGWMAGLLRGVIPGPLARSTECLLGAQRGEDHERSALP